MRRFPNKKMSLVSLSLTALLLAGCGSTADRLARIGQEPPMAQIDNPVYQPDYKPVSLPMPSKVAAPKQVNSLWQSDRQTFFKDQRANDVGDILTITVEIDDEAELENESQRTRTGGEDVDIPALAGIQGEIANALPGVVDPGDLVSTQSTSNFSGDGSIEREEEIRLRLAAMITQVLPNGNFVIYGKQQVRVNHELRELLIGGVIRPEDIQSDNSISYEKIAEARISYGGQGLISDAQKPRYGQEFFDIVLPF